jgi:site-specific recombinase XerD
MKTKHQSYIQKKIRHHGNRNTLLDFVNYSFATGIGNRRVQRYLDVLCVLSRELGKPFKEASKLDVQAYVRKLLESDYTDWTKYTYQIIVRVFYQWLFDMEGHDHPEPTKWMRPRPPSRNSKLPEDMLTEEEVKRMIEVTRKPRNRALIAFLYESGARIGEVMNLRIKDVDFTGDFCRVMLRGKTGMRKIPLITSVPYLTTWINQHPTREDPESLVFVSTGCRNHKKPLSYNTFNKVLLKSGHKARVRKALNPHNFRHSRATHLANKLTEQQLKIYFGWSGNSKMTSTYVHLSGRDIESAILEANGLRKKEERPDSLLRPRQCPRCREDNEATSDICHRCGQPLDTKSALAFEERKGTLEKQMEELTEFKGKIEKLINDAVEKKMQEMGFERV